MKIYLVYLVMNLIIPRIFTWKYCLFYGYAYSTIHYYILNPLPLPARRSFQQKKFELNILGEVYNTSAIKDFNP